MSNNYFQFKEFIIYQDKCGMKVCTDACILGAWAADKMKDYSFQAHMLDIGTGTGLLSLMIAQKSPAIIHAVEIERNAFQQATANFENSPWSGRLKAFNEDARHFSSVIQYDFIISNPPFYQNDMLSPDRNKNIARHNKGLVIDELIGVIKKHLRASGCFALLLPYNIIDFFETLAHSHDFFIKEKMLIRPTAQHEYFRGVLLFGQTKGDAIVRELSIKKGDGNYSEDFILMMKDYYLKL